MKKILNNKGFTLIELLAVIVILGVVMAIAVVSYTSYINNSKKDAFISSAQNYANSISDLMVSEDKLPAAGGWTSYSIESVEMYRGGQSGFDNSDYHGIVFCYNGGNSNNAKYTYYVYIFDESGNYLQAEVKNLSKGKTTTRNYVKTGAEKLTTADGKVTTGTYKGFTDGTTNVNLPTTGINGNVTEYK